MYFLYWKHCGEKRENGLKNTLADTTICCKQIYMVFYHCHILGATYTLHKRSVKTLSRIRLESNHCTAKQPHSTMKWSKRAAAKKRRREGETTARQRSNGDDSNCGFSTVTTIVLHFARYVPRKRQSLAVCKTVSLEIFKRK